MNEGPLGLGLGGPLTSCQGRRPTTCVLGETYSKAQHFVVLGVHGFAFFSPTPGDAALVRLCVKRNPPQFKYNVSLSLRSGADSQPVKQPTKEKSWSSSLGRTLALMGQRRQHLCRSRQRQTWPRGSPCRERSQRGAQMDSQSRHQPLRQTPPSTTPGTWHVLNTQSEGGKRRLKRRTV